MLGVDTSGFVRQPNGLIIPLKLHKPEKKMAEAKEEAKVPATVDTNSALPAHLQGGKKAQLGNIDKSDLIVPRVKLLQAISPEITESNLPGAKTGQFWHTIAGEPMGDRVTFIPVLIRKTIALWSPRNDDRGILARSSDCIHWDEGYANLEFEVKPKGAPKAFKINTGDDVAGSFLVDDPDGPSLDKFGTGVPGDPKSAPMASLTYNMMFYFPDFPGFSPAVVINTRASVKRAQNLISKIELRDVDHYGQKFVMFSSDEKGDEGPYKGYQYQADGFAGEEDYFKSKTLYETFKDANWTANEETDEAPASGGGGAEGVVGGKQGKKF
jgi:hypothetical protein